MDQEFIYTEVKAYLSDKFFCSIEDLEQSNTIYTINHKVQTPYIKIVGYNNCVITCTSEDIHMKVKSALQGKNRDEIFEFPFIYGQTIHYIPNILKISKLPLPQEYSYEFLQGHEINRLASIRGFDNSLVFDNKGNTSTEIVFIAKKLDEIIAIAGAGIETSKMWEVGIDVKSEYRNGGLGTSLVSNLTYKLMEQSIVPFYSVSITNIESQRVANSIGYTPCWIDTYGTVLDGSSIYSSYVKKLQL